MIRRPPELTRTDTPCPYTTRFRSDGISGYTRAAGTVSLGGSPLDGRAPHHRSRAGLGRTFQGIELYEDLTVEENVVVGTTAAADRPTSEDLDQLYDLLGLGPVAKRPVRSAEHTSALQSLMRNSYAVFCLKKKTIYDAKKHD